MSKRPSIEIRICKACVKDCDYKPKKFRRKVSERLEEITTEYDFEVELTSCLKVCPRKNIAFALDARREERKSVRTMTKHPGVDGVVEEVISLTNWMTKG